ncbi:MAG TPA: Rid family detoxifying hydrolase [Anaerolineae bacterium]|nr:Rid family detoxifying hydrolase [Anaerolineae bacterium]
MKEKRKVITSKAPVPVGPYSQAIKAGDFIFCAGQIALDPETGELVNTNIETETARAIENLKEVLEAAGSSLDRVVKTTIFMINIRDFERMNTVYSSYFSGAAPPARSTVQVDALPKGAGIEIECIALAPNT